ncbi:MAG: protein-export membrane protein SecD [Candidatus Fraserbacteria bacterium RBG_16_55_9]|uniref:Protein translocase subunit SecD n=1 Tax=Fraserbacteria sp. (strain RBG_16_55_9) TaxID=1817864 RepID=A0A1F5US59_FRAXR|nr:MAG: protein-export membrane protein SecD [Candidatus Fraserbacteria bacterium RBG_16_55_9]
MNPQVMRWIRAGLIGAALLGSLAVLYLEKPILGLDLRGGVMLLLQADPVEFSKLSPADQAKAIDQIVQTVRFRVNATGLAETTVTQAGADRVWVEIPCPAPPEPCTEPQQVRDLIERRGFLEFKKVLKQGIGASDEVTPSNTTEEVVYDRVGTPYLVPTEPLLTGAAISSARTQPALQGGPYVVILTFTDEGAKHFAQVLTDGTLKGGDLLAIILDGRVESSPRITGPEEQGSIITAARQGWRSIQDGTQISGQPTLDEANNLSIVLRSGNLPVPIQAIFQDEIGPSLGQDSINKGLFATVLAGALVLLFMLFYYRLCGGIANLTLFLNLLMLVAAMMLLNATWTLPGIAGLILTIGMGVDSNVLIFERVREELRSGKTVRAAIDFGYERALLTIIDSHVTTLITALILFTFGTGPIKGFATVLSMGLVINLFTALSGTRLAFEIIKQREPRRLSI